MKKTFRSILDKAAPQQLDSFFDSFEAEAVSAKTITALEAEIAGSSKAKRKKPLLRKWILPAASAVSIVILAGILIGLPLFPKRPAPPEISSPAGTSATAVPDKAAPTARETKADFSSSASETEPGTESGLPLYLREETDDHFAVMPETGAGKVSADIRESDRLFYDGIRFFEDGDTTYMIYAEFRPLYRLEGTKWTASGHYSPELLFFANGIYHGWAYAGGIFHCDGGYEKGLFRVKLQSGEIEKVIDCKETVSSAVVSGGKIYYTCFSGFGDQALYSLKCADPEKGTIECLLSNWTYPIRDLQMNGETLYFRSFPQGIFFITGDLTLHLIPSPSVSAYCVQDSVIFTYSITADKASTKKSKTVCAFLESGEALASRRIEEFTASDGSRGDRYYVGGSRDSLTVYQGKIVSFDESGFYLEDLISESREKILDCVFTGTEQDGYLNTPFYHSVSKTVLNGKLYLQYGNTIVEYDNGTIRTLAPE